MPTYRAYLLSHGHVEQPPRSFEAADDVKAVDQTRQLVNGHDVELWRGGRCVVVLKRQRYRPHRLVRAVWPK